MKADTRTLARLARLAAMRAASRAAAADRTRRRLADAVRAAAAPFDTIGTGTAASFALCERDRLTALAAARRSQALADATADEARRRAARAAARAEALRALSGKSG